MALFKSQHKWFFSKLINIAFSFSGNIEVKLKLKSTISISIFSHHLKRGWGDLSIIYCYIQSGNRLHGPKQLAMCWTFSSQLLCLNIAFVLPFPGCHHSCQYLVAWMINFCQTAKLWKANYSSVISDEQWNHGFRT